MSNDFRRWNKITGWLVFFVALVVYLMTVEPTVSFWDCGEFILCSFRLEVGHPPGAPLFLLIGRLFSLFAGSDTSHVAVWINRFSALASAFTILFLFWTITRLVRMASKSLNEPKGAQIIAVLASGAIGALAYAFSDTFWFSAVEGEVYATSSLFTALVFWAMLRWYDEADEPYANRWIILIAYMMGLSIGIHLLNLLAIPVIVLIYYFKKYEVTPKGTVKAILLSFAILGILNFIFIPGVATVAGWFELFFVNVVGLPFNSGLWIYLITFVGLIVYGIWYSFKKNKTILNYALTVIAVIMIGYSSFALIIIRANAHPPMNQNDPSDVFSFIYYINRTQYGKTPLLYGPYYSAPPTGMKDKISGYNKVNGEYEPYYYPEYEYDKRLMTLFPRMYSSDPNHISQYEYWGKVKGRKLNLQTRAGSKQVAVPSFSENMRFFFRYQVGYMYMRYFMWNFVGRQNDQQGNGNVMDGNWISGLSFLDNPRLGDQAKMPPDLLNNPARNTYFFLPLIAGLIGLFWHYKRHRKGFWLVMVLFLMTGMAIVVYLNQYPNQPRERDYAYAGSFYAFTIWIGLAVAALFDFLSRKMKEETMVAAVCPALLLFFAVPLLMLVKNYDDHDRSDRYSARDIASNYLNSCDKNAVLLTYGDNDSFPLWYAQDVEGIRTDIRVANLSYLQSGFYIETMSKKAFDSDPLPFTLPVEKYDEGKRVQLPVEDMVKEPYDIRKIVEFTGSEDKKAKVDLSGNGDYYNFIPATKFVIEVDTNLVVANGTVKPYFRDRMESPMIWTFNGETAYKNDLAIMDFMAGNNWKRPLYYAVTVPATSYIGLENHYILEGMAYRISPVTIDKPQQGETGMIDTETTYDNMMNKFKWGNADVPGVYLDENNRRIYNVFRRQFGRLAKELALSGDKVRAVAAAERGMSIVLPEKMPFDYWSIDLAQSLMLAGEKEKASALFTSIINNSVAELKFVATLDDAKSFGLDYHSGIALQSLLEIYNVANENGLTDVANNAAEKLNRYYGERPGK